MAVLLSLFISFLAMVLWDCYDPLGEYPLIRRIDVRREVPFEFNHCYG